MSEADASNRQAYEQLLEESRNVSKEEVKQEDAGDEEPRDADSRLILITVDGSENARRAFDYALSNVLHPGSKDVAHLVHHYNIHDPSVFAPIALEAMQAEKSARRKAGVEILKAFGKTLREKNIKAKAHLLCGGDLRDAVLEYSNKLKPDMLIVGCRGHGSLKRALLGSLSSHLVHHSEVPVLVVR